MTGNSPKAFAVSRVTRIESIDQFNRTTAHHDGLRLIRRSNSFAAIFHLSKAFRGLPGAKDYARLLLTDHIGWIRVAPPEIRTAYRPS